MVQEKQEGFGTGHRLFSLFTRQQPLSEAHVQSRPPGRAKHEGVIHFDKRTQTYLAGGLVLIFILIFYGVSRDIWQPATKSSNVFSKHKPSLSRNEADSIKALIPERSVLANPFKTEGAANDTHSLTPDWYSGDIKQEHPSKTIQIDGPAPLPPASAPAPASPPQKTVITSFPAKENPDESRRKAADAAAAQAGTSIAFTTSSAAKKIEKDMLIGNNRDKSSQKTRYYSFKSFKNPFQFLERTYLNYEFSGEELNRPIRVFDDGMKTYIQVSAELWQSNQPIMLIANDTDKAEEITRYQFGDSYYFVVDRVMVQSTLLIGDDSGQQKKIMITRH